MSFLGFASDPSVRDDGIEEKIVGDSDAHDDIQGLYLGAKIEKQTCSENFRKTFCSTCTHVVFSSFE